MKNIFAAILLLFVAIGLNAQDIIHDAEYYILEAQNGERWSAEDKDLDKKLATLKRSMEHLLI